MGVPHKLFLENIQMGACFVNINECFLEDGGPFFNNDLCEVYIAGKAFQKFNDVDHIRTLPEKQAHNLKKFLVVLNQRM